MAALSVPGVTLMGGELRPKRFAAGTSSTSSLEVSYAVGIGQSQILVLGVDITATQAEPVGPLFASAGITDTGPFYWDSQSTGEGLGVTFSWRGQMPVFAGETVYANISGSSLGAVLCAYIWGVIGPFAAN